MKIRELRMKAKISQQTMSKEFEIPKRTIENWETEKRKCPPYVEKLICEKLERVIEEGMKKTSQDIFYKHIDAFSANTKKHTARVVDMCCTFSQQLNLKPEDKALLIDAAWLHDIAKYDDGEHHTEESVTRAVKEVAGSNNSLENLDTICEIIKNHKGGFEPKSDYEILAAILRISDKLDKFDKAKTKTGAEKQEEAKKNAQESCEKSLRKIKEVIPNLPEQFVPTYNVLIEERGGIPTES